MTKGLKEKAVTGIFWSLSDSLATQLTQFITGLILARILSPEEFGLVGMITVFIAISQSLSDGGFGDALIRKQNTTADDYSTAFYFNLIVSALVFGILYLTAPAVARFYSRPELVEIERVLGLTILINAFCIIQRTHITKQVDFRMLMKVNLTSSFISGVISIIMALTGFGVWSLVWRSIIRSVVQAIILWTTNKWRPIARFSRESFISLFSFGSKMLLSGLIDTIYNNVYLLIIGKFYSASQLGYYTRADQFSRLPSRNMMLTVQKVSFPVLSQVQDEPERLREGFRRIIVATMLVSFVLMLGMAAVAEPMIITLIGEKWYPAVEYLQWLCLAAMLFPLHALNVNMITVKGRSDIVLKLEVVKKLLAIPVIVIGIFLGIRPLLIGMVVLSFIYYFINAFYSGKLLNYRPLDQLSDIIPSFIVASVSAGIAYSLRFIPELPQAIMLLMQLMVLILLSVALSRKFKLKGYIEIRNIMIEKIPALQRIL